MLVLFDCAGVNVCAGVVTSAGVRVNIGAVDCVRASAVACTVAGAGAGAETGFCARVRAGVNVSAVDCY